MDKRLEIFGTPHGVRLRILSDTGGFKVQEFVLSPDRAHDVSWSLKDAADAVAAGALFEHVTSA